MKRAARSFQPRYRKEWFGELIQIDGLRIIGLKIEAPHISLLPLTKEDFIGIKEIIKPQKS